MDFKRSGPETNRTVFLSPGSVYVIIKGHGDSDPVSKFSSRVNSPGSEACSAQAVFSNCPVCAT